jgi:hypothetical protein
MSDTLELASAEDLADLGTFATRAKDVDADGAMRLQGFGGVLAATVGIRSGTGILGDGTILGMRMIALTTPSTVDVTVPLSAITDRTARGGSSLPVPPVTQQEKWAAVTPPRSGWSPSEESLDPDLVAAARALGFVRPGEQPNAFRSGRWTRVSTAAGHVLGR